MGERKAAIPYIGNIQIEVFPISFSSFFLKELKPVHRISMHQPSVPQIKKLFFILFIIDENDDNILFVPRKIIPKKGKQ